MSIPVFVLRALWITPQVMLRFLPVLAVYVLISVGLFFATENPYVIGLTMFLLGTFGYAFLVVQGLRAALQALKLTDAPTASGLMAASARMLFVYFLLQLLLLLLFGAIIGAIFYYIVIPVMDPAAAETLRMMVEGRDRRRERTAGFLRAESVAGAGKHRDHPAELRLHPAAGRDHGRVRRADGRDFGQRRCSIRRTTT